MSIAPEIAAAPRTSRYEICEYIGSGASGLVYKAVDRVKNFTVALKSLKFLEPEEIYYLKGEFRTLRDIYHPNLVQLYDLSVDPDDHCFFTMEFVEGQDFLAFSQGGVRPNSDNGVPTVNFESLRVALGQIVDGIEALHRSGVAHRDIKPSNIFVEPDGRTVILDFGLSLGLELDETMMTRARHTAGTPAYMAPERLMGKSPTPEGDWFSVGVMLYQAITNRHPFLSFDDTSPVAFFEAQRRSKSQAPSPKEINKDTPDDLDELIRGLLSWDPDKRPAAKAGRLYARDLASPFHVEPTAVQLKSGPQVFVGRRKELRLLHDTFQRTQSGDRLAVRIDGPPGIGKTTLVERFLDQIHDADRYRDSAEALVLRSQCHGQEEIQFKALDGLVDSLSHFLKQDSKPLQRLAKNDLFALTKVFPILQRVPIGRSLPTSTHSHDPHIILKRATRALHRVIQSLAEEQPVILWIDDLHWSDSASIPFIRDFLRDPAQRTRAGNYTISAPMLILSHRSDEGEQIIDDLLGDDRDLLRIINITVAPLDAAESRELFDKYVGDEAAIDNAVASQLTEDSEGLPLFLMELAHYYRTVDGAERRTDPPPRHFDEILARRLASLPDAHKHVLELVAVARRPIPEDLVAQITGDDATRAAAIYTLCRENLLRRSLSGGRSSIESYHENIRHALLPKQNSPRRIRLHKVIAEGLERYLKKLKAEGEIDDPAIVDQYELLVEHFLGAQENSKVAMYSLLAGRAAANRLSFNRAAEHLALALELRDRGVEDWQIREEHAGALANAGRAVESGQEYLAAGEAMLLAESDTPGAPDKSLRATREKVWATEQFLYGGMLSDGLRLLREVFGELQLPFPISARQARLMSLRNRLRLLPFILGLRDFRLKLNSDEISPKTRLRLETLWIAAKGTVMLDYGLGDVMTSRYAKEALLLGDQSMVIRAMGLEASVYANIGGTWMLRRSRTLMQQANQLAVKSSVPYDRAMLQICATTISWCTGNWQGCADPARKATVALRDCEGTNFDLAIVHGFSLSARVFLGDFEKLRTDVAMLLDAAEKRGDRYFTSVFQSGYLVFLHLALDRPDHALEKAKATLQGVPTDRFTSMHFHHFNAYTNSLLYSGKPWQAWLCVVRTWPRLTQAGFPSLACIGAHLREIRARCALAAAAHPEDASASLTKSQAKEMAEYTVDRLLRIAAEEARQINKRSLPHTPGLASLVRAGIAALRGNTDVECEELRAAADIFGADSVGMGLHEEVSLLQLATVNGDQQGRLDAERRMRNRGILRPDLMASLLVPGQ